MKTIALIAAVFAVSLTGCAVQPNTSVSSSYDLEKVAQINNIARGRGVEVQWVNLPRRKVVATEIAPSLGEPTGT